MHARPSSRTPANPAALSNPFFRTPEERVDEARSRYFEHGLRPSGLVGEAVLQSWSRCLKHGRQPADAPVFEPVSRSRTSDALERSEHLLRAAAPELDQIERALAGTRCKTMLVDRRGMVVHAAAESGGELLDVSARLGVDLSELSFGSTAPGISAHDDSVCAVAGNEHFHGVLRQIHCVAAPVHNRNGQIAGVLDLSIEGRGFAFDALSMVRLSALAIENRLMAVPGPDECVVALQTRASLLDTPLVALLGIDARGRVAWANPAARALVPESAQRGSVEDTLGVHADRLRAWAEHPGDWEGFGASAMDRTHTLVLPTGLMVWVRVLARGDAVTSRTPPAAPPAAVTSSSPMAIAPMATPSRGSDDLPERPGPTAAPGASSLEPTLPDDAHSTPSTPTADAGTQRSLDAANRAVIEAALVRHGGNVSKAARELGVSRGLLYRRLRAWGSLAGH
jgi:sigma-54 dependent transcriptional regulator, acetoin dehydrogenase operon transcriptional activator AcoR